MSTIKIQAKINTYKEILPQTVIVTDRKITNERVEDGEILRIVNVNYIVHRLR